MPIKQRISKRRKITVSPAALAIWRAVGPQAIEARGNCAMIVDAPLAGALGLPLLLWHETAFAALVELRGGI